MPSRLAAAMAAANDLITHPDRWVPIPAPTPAQVQAAYDATDTWCPEHQWPVAHPGLDPDSLTWDLVELALTSPDLIAATRTLHSVNHPGRDLVTKTALAHNAAHAATLVEATA